MEAEKGTYFPCGRVADALEGMDGVSDWFVVWKEGSKDVWHKQSILKLSVVNLRWPRCSKLEFLAGTLKP